MAGMYFLSSVPDDFASVMKTDVEAFKRFFHALLDQGVYLPPSPVEAFFFSSAHGEDEIVATIAAARKAFAVVKG